MDILADIIKTLLPIAGVCVGAYITSYFAHIWPAKREENNNAILQYKEALKIRYILLAHYNFLSSDRILNWIKEKEEEDRGLLLECEYFENEIVTLRLDQLPIVFEDLNPNVIDKLCRSMRIFHALISAIKDHTTLIRRAVAYYNGDMGDDFEYKLKNIHNDLETLHPLALEITEEAKSMYLAYFEKKYPASKALN